MLKYESELKGIPASCIKAQIRKTGSKPADNIFCGDVSSQIEEPHKNGGTEGFVSFAADESVELILCFPANVKNAVFRPSLRKKTELSIRGNTVSVVSHEERYGILEVNYQQNENEEIPVYTVYIFHDRIMEDPHPDSAECTKFLSPGFHSRRDTDPGSMKTLCFLPGLHEIEDSLLELVSGHNIHISRGAVLRAGLYGNDVENVTVTGQGILDGSTTIRGAGINHLSDSGREAFICLFKGKNILLDGFILYNPHFWNIVLVGTSDTVIRNHKAISWVLNNDGVQPRSCNNLLVEKSFFKCNDDGIAVKTRRAAGMISKNLSFRDLVMWNDRCGNALELGHSSQGDLLENILFENIEIIHGTRRAAIDACIVDHSLVRNVVYENIYVEGRKFEYDIALIVPDYLNFASDAQRGCLKNIRIKGFYSDSAPCKYMIHGNSKSNKIENISFQSLYYFYGNEKKEYKISSIDELSIDSRFTENILLENNS